MADELSDREKKFLERLRGRTLPAKPPRDAGDTSLERLRARVREGLAAPRREEGSEETKPGPATRPQPRWPAYFGAAVAAGLLVLIGGLVGYALRPSGTGDGPGIQLLGAGGEESKRLAE